MIGKETSASESGEKEGRMCVIAVKMCLSVCDVENWPLMVVVLFMKHLAKLSAIRVEEGGRGEGFKFINLCWYHT